MDSFTYNKIAGAFLGTCLVGAGIGIIAGGIFNPDPPAKPGYVPPKPEASAETPAKPVEADAGPALPVLLSKADAKKGQADAQVCTACHNLKEGGGVLVGPPLWGVVNRPKGSVPGFDYSAGMKAKGGNWTFADINQFITKPSAYVEGTKMGYPGESNPAKRADILAYLATLASTPVPMPPVADAAKAPPAPGPAVAAPAAPGKTVDAGGDDDLLKLIAGSDPKRGHTDAQVCSACHNLKQGGGVLVGPPLWGVVGRPKGSVPGFEYSAGMKAKGGTWTYADINTFITKPSAYVEGTKMGFAGESNPKKRAEIIAFLRTLAVTPVPLAVSAAGTPAPAAAAPAPAAAAPVPPNQKTEVAPATAPSTNTASLGPEPYEAADPQYPTKAAATPAAAEGANPSVANPAVAAAPGPEPYDGADPQYPGTLVTDAAPAPAAAEPVDSADRGPEPYNGVDPQYPETASLAPTPKAPVAAKPVDTASLGPEPYEGVDPQYPGTPPAAASVTIQIAPTKAQLASEP